MTDNHYSVDVAKIESSIEMLRVYVQQDSIEPVISILELMKEDPRNESLLSQLSETFGEIGIEQGAILTYAPYVAILVSEDPYGLN